MAAQKLIGQQLIELGLITEEQLDVALNLQKKRKERLGELLFSLGFISESDILKVLAERFRIHYITADKLASIKIPKIVLDMVPMDYAERKFVLPLMYDQEGGVLSVLANTPTDPKLIKEVQLLAQCCEVNAYLALKPTIMAGVRKFYRGDPRSFTSLEERSMNQSPMMSFGATTGNDRQAVLTTDELQAHTGLRLADEVISSSLLSDNVFVETLNILISLLEMKRGSFRGHSASVARLTKKVSEKLELMPKDVYLNVVAAYLHDLGKREGVHYTLINLNTERDLKLAQKFYLSPIRLIETAHFPSLIPQILTHLFERYDGKGFPKGLSGENIPLGSRIIAVVDAYEDLVRHPDWTEKSATEVLRELFNYQGTCFDRRVLKALYEVVQEAQQGASLMPGEAMKTILLIDPSGNGYAPLIARLKEAGLRVLVAHDTDAAVQAIKRTRIELVLSEVNTQPLSGHQLCSALKSSSQTKGIPFVFITNQEMPSKLVSAAFDVGADDFFQRPIRVEIVLAKVKRLIAIRHETLTEMQAQTTPPRASVTGSLEDISLTDIVQLFSNSRKTGMLTLARQNEEAKVFFENGQVINCYYKGKDGVEAFYLLLEWEHGDFAFETDVTIPEIKINLPTENLMLEGFRLLDERRAGR